MNKTPDSSRSFVRAMPGEGEPIARLMRISPACPGAVFRA